MSPSSWSPLLLSVLVLLLLLTSALPTPSSGRSAPAPVASGRSALLAEPRLAPPVAPGGSPHGPALPAVSAANPYLWTNRTVSAHPSPRASAMMAYDPSLGKVVLFGGWNGSVAFNDTWTYLGGTWTELATPRAPPPRMGGALVWDPQDGYLLLFGGWNWSGYYNDTWMFKGGAWTELHPDYIPPGRDLAGIAYDAGDHYVLLFGGLGVGAANLNDTWSFIAGNWTHVLTPSTLPGRNGPGMVYDAVDGYVVMTQGEASVYENDMWSFHAGTWTEITTSVTPSARDGAELVYDDATSYTMLFGGEHVGVYLNDTWSYVGGTFTNLAPVVSPPTVQYPAGAFDPVDRYVVSFGGAHGARVLAQTWTWGTPLPLTLTTTDSGAATTVGTTEYYAATVSGGVPHYTFAWQFGDGSTGTNGKAQHAYSWPGNYTINCTVTDSNGTQATQSLLLMVTWGAGTPVSVTISAPASPPSGPAPLTVSFSGFATAGFPPYTPSWNFGDGSAPVTGWNLSHPYAAAGSYTAVLTATDRAGRTGSASLVVSVSTPVIPPLQLSVAASTKSGTAPLAVSFTSTATGGAPPYTFSWNFGDGGSSAQENASHTYLTGGTWPASLTVVDAAHPAHSVTKVVYISVTNATTNATSPGTGFLGLPGDEGFLVVGAIVGVVVIVAVVAVVMLRRRPPEGTEAPGYAYPPHAYSGPTESYPPTTSYPRTPYPPRPGTPRGPD